MNISFSLRAFIIYILILGSLSWFLIDKAVERINISMRQSAENVLVDTSRLFASMIELELEEASSDTVSSPTTSTTVSAASSTIATSTISTAPVEIDASMTKQFSKIWEKTLDKQFEAQVYELNKTNVDLHVYVTNKQGIVIYDSSNLHMGEDYMVWRDIRLTLQGKYGSRTSYVYRDQREAGDPKIMVIAAPIKHDGEIVGALSVTKDIKSLEFFLFSETETLKRYTLMLVLLALTFGYLLSHWFTLMLRKVDDYARSMAKGLQVEKPKFLDSRMRHLADSIEFLRNEVDGKSYVEDYIHSLTHELKTPITSIHAAVEILHNDLSDADKLKFLGNIESSNERMASLVERMLSLAKIERLSVLGAHQTLDVQTIVETLLEERVHSIAQRNIIVEHAEPLSDAFGDPLLIQQAVANLLDNAIDFCVPMSEQANSESAQAVINVRSRIADNNYILEIENTGNPIPAFAFEKLYDRFFSLSRPNKSKSTGLGLSFVKEIMSLHQGDVELKNTDQGVLAALSWPLQ